jgi:concentrative nucleoside transporter, CNT family
MAILQGLFGIAVFVSIAYLFSTNRKAIDWKLVGIGLALQIIFGLLVMKVPIINQGFQVVGEGFVALLGFTGQGAQFVFGGLAKNSYVAKDAGHSMGLIVAFQVLTTVIFFATLSAGLYYLGVLQKIVYGIAWVMSRTMGLSGPESLSAAANIFMGQTEAPLLVKPFIEKMTYSELMCLMTGGMATIAGGVLAAYVGFLGGNDPAQQAMFAAHLLSASVMNAPAAVVMAKMIVPQTEPEKIMHKLEISEEKLGVNLLDALSNGARDGLFLALNIGAMLIAFIALIAMLNAILINLAGLVGLNAWVEGFTNGTFKAFSLEYVFGQIGQPLALAMGVDFKDSLQVGSLLGQKTAINEFIAYQNLAIIKNDLDAKSLIISTYALCGFSNFSSIAIQIGGIGTMAPSQQSNLSRLGLRALLAASMACMLTGTVAGAVNSL